jgi:hypothetical protein
MRLSLMKAAHAVLGGAAYRKFESLNPFFGFKEGVRDGPSEPLLSGSGHLRTKLNKSAAACVGMHDGKDQQSQQKHRWTALVTSMH